MKNKTIDIIGRKFNFKYPKFLLLFMTFVLAYLIFSGRTYLPLNNALLNLGYFGTFIAGMLFAYGFTAAPATAILMILAKEQNLLVTGLIAGFGALLADLIIFRFVRSHFQDEVDNLSKEKIIQKIHLLPGRFFYAMRSNESPELRPLEARLRPEVHRELPGKGAASRVRGFCIVRTDHGPIANGRFRERILQGSVGAGHGAGHAVEAQRFRCVGPGEAWGAARPDRGGAVGEAATLQRVVVDVVACRDGNV